MQSSSSVVSCFSWILDMQILKARCFTCALFGHALSASVLLVLSPLVGMPSTRDISFSFAMMLDLAELHGLGSGTLLMPALDLS